MAQASSQVAGAFSSSSSPLLSPPGDARFGCNICLEAVTEPVVTQCGHLYCWPCLFRWLEPGMVPSERQALGLPAAPLALTINESRRLCPVCKAPCSVPSLVPVYVRNLPDEEANGGARAGDESQEKSEEPISPSTPPPSPPSRPQASSDEVEQEENREHDSTPTRQHDSSNIARTAEDVDQSTGLRRRRPPQRGASAAESEAAAEAESSSGASLLSTPVPARPPPANSPTRSPPPPRSAVAATPNHDSSSNPLPLVVGGTPIGRPRIVHHHHPSPVLYGARSGLAQTFQQALALAVEQSQAAAAAASASRHHQYHPSRGEIPPLHRREGHGNAAAAAADAPLPGGPAFGAMPAGDALGDPDATEFLSRILLLLGSFVILCLLLF